MQLPWVAEAFVSCAAGSFVGRRPKTRSAGHYKDLTKRETAHEKPLAPRVRSSEQNSRFKNADQMIFFSFDCPSGASSCNESCTIPTSVLAVLYQS